MIAYLDGILVENAVTSVVVEVNGVGYDIAVPLSTSEHLPLEGARVRLLTYLQVREDQWQLFGFCSRAERDLFKLLIGAVNGVGPKVALSVLSSLSVDGFSHAVAEGDCKTLGKIPGVGKKMAERMIVELRDKLKVFTTPGGAGQVPAPAPMQSAGKFGGNLEAMDAVLALETLGYRHDNAMKAVETLVNAEDGDKLKASELIKRALAALKN